jgi:hypothetical protein
VFIICAVASVLILSIIISPIMEKDEQEAVNKIIADTIKKRAKK